jgi:exodeoxyribonuclease VII small subunit
MAAVHIGRGANMSAAKPDKQSVANYSRLGDNMTKPSRPKIPADIAKLNFEKALEELEGIVGKLESGDVDLEESIKIYERGTLLKAHCESKLAAAKAKVDKIALFADGSVSTEAGDIS